MNAKRFGTSAETTLRAFLQARGYLVIRSAASKCLDLVCVRPTAVYGLEVKATHGNVYYASRNKNAIEQQKELVKMGDDYPAIRTYFAVKFLDGFEVFAPYETICRRGGGVPIEEFFPHLLHSPNIPPIVPRETDAYLERAYSEDIYADDRGPPLSLVYKPGVGFRPTGYAQPNAVTDDRDGQGGGTD